MSVTIFLVALRKFWLLLAFGGLLGGGLGVAAATFLAVPPAPPLYEAKIESVVLSGDEAEARGLRFLRATSVSTEISWFFPARERSSSRAATVGTLLLLEPNLEKLADTVGVSSTELKVRIALGQSGSPDVLVVRVFGASEEQSEQLVVAVLGAILELHEDFYPGLPAPILLASSSAPPSLSEQGSSEELLAWRHSVVPGFRVFSPDPLLQALEPIRSAANEVYVATAASDREASREVSGPPAFVTFSVKSPNRLVAVIQHTSSEGVAAELSAIVDALEAAGRLQEPFEKSSAVVVLDIGAPLPLLSSPSVDRAPVIVASGVLLGVSLAGLFALVSLSQRRILWSPTQMFAVAKAPPIAVVSRRKSDRANTVIAPENPGIVTLRTNLFHGDGGSRRVAFTSPASNFDQGAVATVLAESLARLGGRVAVLDTGAGELFYSLPESAPIRRESSGSSPRGRPSVLSIEHPGSDAFDLVTLGPHVSGSSDFYLSSDWQAALSWLDQNYDHSLVILDSVLAGLGAAEAAIGSGRVIVTIRPGETRPQDLAAALTQLAQSGSPAPEIVVVGVPPDDVGYWYLSTPTLGE